MRVRVRRTLATLTLAAAAGCGGAGSDVTSPTQPDPVLSSYPGFDTSIYPGDAAMQAWRYPASPYYWAGYYLPAPCHRDITWSGKRSTLNAMGWGLAAIYVGQQDWSQIPADVAPATNRVSVRGSSRVSVQQQATCSASLLSTAQGTAEAADAIARMRADGFPDRSVIFLDVEYVTTVQPALLDYVRGWIAGVLADGHYRVGVYAAKSNAQKIYEAALLEYHGSTDMPAFWIASSSNFNIAKKPSDVGFSYAQVWQGLFDLSQTFNGVRLLIDVDVATQASPSAPK